ncbi:hypothetical protein C4D60_Mb07t26690 [Musa balbisiana]|uniref:Uncharacterized protein n=1 Tax=Musa balbisiana TaxID=52838 RepID=A0A4S8JIG7_MUSBA|nr:hypothetical protein C4D60_Mb07t26690 [Musa balbisiana]
MQGSRIYAGFTRLCKGLAVVLVGGYVLLQIFPSILPYVVLIPSRKENRKEKREKEDEDIR